MLRKPFKKSRRAFFYKKKRFWVLCLEAALVRIPPFSKGQKQSLHKAENHRQATTRENDKCAIVAGRSRRYISPCCFLLHRRLREYPWPRGAGIAEPGDREEKVISVSKRVRIDRDQNTG